MRYLSVCSGIEAATVAWHPLGFQPVAYSEIEPFPSAVLKHHYPDVPNLGDMTKFKEWPNAAVDVLVGGTPCQSFSVAGLRKGLDDPRGNLTLVYLAIAAKYRPRWLVWENVPGVLSDATGAFGAFLGGLGELGYGFAYRVLDAQHFGIPQRRRRVFVVGCAGGWQRAAAVLFEIHSLQVHPAPSRKAREVAPTIPSRSTGGGGLGTDFDCDGGIVTGPITAGMHKGMRGTEGVDSNWMVPVAFAQNQRDEVRPIAWDEELNPLIDVAGTVVRGGAGGRHDGVMTFHPTQDPIHSTDVCHALNANANANATVALRGRAGGATAELGEDVGHALRASSGGGDKPHVLTAMQVRRLTPRECERLQGFPDDYTAIPWRNKPADQCPDGPRYKALGNSFAVPVVAWIGKRIQMVADIVREAA